MTTVAEKTPSPERQPIRGVVALVESGITDWRIDTLPLEQRIVEEQERLIGSSDPLVMHETPPSSGGGWD